MQTADDNKARRFLEESAEMLAKQFGYRDEMICQLPLESSSFYCKILNLKSTEEEKQVWGRFSRDFGRYIESRGIICYKGVFPSSPPRKISFIYIPTATQALNVIRNDFDDECVVFFNGGDHVEVSNATKNGLRLGKCILALVFAYHDDHQIGYTTNVEEGTRSWPKNKKAVADEEKTAVIPQIKYHENERVEKVIIEEREKTEQAVREERERCEKAVREEQEKREKERERYEKAVREERERSEKALKEERERSKKALKEERERSEKALKEERERSEKALKEERDRNETQRRNCNCEIS